MSKTSKYYLYISIMLVLFSLVTVTGEILVFFKISSDATNVSEQHLRLEGVVEKQSSLAKLEGRYKDIEENIPQINNTLPDKKEASKLLADLDSLAKESGLRLTMVQAVSANKKQTASDDPSLLQTIKGKNSLELPLQLKLEGGFSGFSSFVKRIENYQRLINISSIDIKRASKEDNKTDQIEADLKVTAYLKK